MPWQNTRHGNEEDSGTKEVGKGRRTKAW